MGGNMTSAMKRLLASLCWVALLGGQSLASEPTSDSEPVSETLPAVDGVNAKVSILGAVDGVNGFGAAGAVTFPIGHHFGFQVDGVAAHVETDLIGDIDVYATAAHLFWRDPSVGLLGLYGDVAHLDILNGLNFYTGGIEGALYLGQFTLHGLAGINDGDLIDTGFFSRARFSYYPIDDLELHIGLSYTQDRSHFLYGAEWAFANNASVTPSLFVNGTLSESGDSGAVFAGLRFYLGQHDKSLLRRHREDDPPLTDVFEGNIIPNLVLNPSHAGYLKALIGSQF